MALLLLMNNSLDPLQAMLKNQGVERRSLLQMTTLMARDSFIVLQ